jgi:REP element-mobilizing transposase RayT
MATHSKHTEIGTIYFITFTCFEWLPLFDKTSLYEYFNKWFDYLLKNDASLVGYVIMPNHFHGLVYLGDKCGVSLNNLVGNGKRFLAYEIVERLKKSGQSDLLTQLSSHVRESEKNKNKQHEVFRLSFDAKKCFNRKIVEQKLDYIHHNPVSGKWSLVEDWRTYPYSSAGFYELGKDNKYLLHYRDVI